MKKSLFTLIVLSALTLTGMTLAQAAPDAKDDAGMKADCPIGKMGMHGMMGMGGMGGGRDVVATSDGGVVILQGSTLSKYDKNLNLVKEVQVKGGMDMQEMHKMMKDCPMMNKAHGKMMKGHDKDGDDDDDDDVK